MVVTSGSEKGHFIHRSRSRFVTFEEAGAGNFFVPFSLVFQILRFGVLGMFLGSSHTSSLSMFGSLGSLLLTKLSLHPRNIICYNSVIGAIPVEGAVPWRNVGGWYCFFSCFKLFWGIKYCELKGFSDFLKNPQPMQTHFCSLFLSGYSCVICCQLKKPLSTILRCVFFDGPKTC